MNADDWGRDRDVTDRTLSCVLLRTVSSVSAMVFMEDSKRAAEIALEHGIDVGLHLNFTSPFSASGIPTRLLEHQQLCRNRWRHNRFSQVVFHPGLIGSFEYVVAANVTNSLVFSGGKPIAWTVTIICTFAPTCFWVGCCHPEQSFAGTSRFSRERRASGNRFYRQTVDRILASRHRLTNFFFSLQPITFWGDSCGSSR